MDYEEKILEREQDAREEGLVKGREEGLKRGVKILVFSLKRAGNTKQEIMHLLEQNYGSDFTDEQLENFLKESQNILPTTYLIWFNYLQVNRE
ncbi:MAG: hypothetical protein LKH59_04095 [Lactobacillus crispatus]|jgi:type II secretory pathway component GspD/PulD (secretin)|nr:hypothetical protein [Lactobacillus crispatus]MCI1335751.1 hypothetical protein [Lactobacillus crispatus]MCI1365109.1 hypothetical protein [Lactobacillus crispatus]MCI1493166.1 hypothetical protein [Lactobacillus crispatus]MCI1538051.1 hypothetical protein [Lactobacillus crispatus]